MRKVHFRQVRSQPTADYILNGQPIDEIRYLR